MSYTNYPILISLITYTLILLISICILLYKNKVYEIKFLVPSLFLLLFSLYIYPLSLFCLSNTEPQGDISYLLDSFIDYLPISLIFCSLFLVVFSIIFRFGKFNVKKHIVINGTEKLNILEKIILFVILLCSVYLIYLLGKSAGGILGLILSGYKVTELFVGKSQYAIAFDWIVAIVLLFWGDALKTKKKKYIVNIFILVIILTIAFVIMGRRAVLVVLISSAILLYHFIYKKIPIYIYIIFAISGFLFLNLVGLLRGDKYDNISSVVSVLEKRNDKLTNESADYLYTIKTGNFAVPFETFPVMIRDFGENYYPGFGLYSIRSISFIIPNFLWKDRPLPLANWYMNKYYGNNSSNEGRQFFFLSEGYMNFGPLGIFIWGVIFAYLCRYIVLILEYGSKNILLMVLVSLLISNFLNIISTDSGGFVFAFIKGYGFPVLFLIFLSLIKIKI